MGTLWLWREHLAGNRDYGRSLACFRLGILVHIQCMPPVAGVSIWAHAINAVRDWRELLSFSLGAMTTLTLSGLVPRDTLMMRTLMPLEALLGIFLAGLLGFVVGNRIRRS